MDDKIRQALGQLQAPQQVKDRAYQAVLEKVAPKPKRRPVWQPALAFCALLVFLLGAGGWVYLIPTAYLSVDVNPSLELGINRFGTVVRVDAYNADGETLAQSLQARFRGYEDVVEELLELDVVNAPGATLTLTVAGGNETQCQRILSQVEEESAGCWNVQCQGASLEERDQALEAGLTLGKYRVYVEIAALDSAFTPEEAQSMTMAQLRRKLEELSGEESTAGNGQGSGSGQGAGAGNGQGSGSGQGAGAGNGQGSGSGQGAGAGNGRGKHKGQGNSPAA